jgi:hypothetical protein
MLGPTLEYLRLDSKFAGFLVFKTNLIICVIMGATLLNITFTLCVVVFEDKVKFLLSNSKFCKFKNSRLNPRLEQIVLYGYSNV